MRRFDRFLFLARGRKEGIARPTQTNPFPFHMRALRYVFRWNETEGKAILIGSLYKLLEEKSLPLDGKIGFLYPSNKEEFKRMESTLPLLAGFKYRKRKMHL